MDKATRHHDILVSSVEQRKEECRDVHGIIDDPDSSRIFVTATDAQEESPHAARDISCNYAQP